MVVDVDVVVEVVDVEVVELLVVEVVEVVVELVVDDDVDDGAAVVVGRCVVDGDVVVEVGAPGTGRAAATDVVVAFRDASSRARPAAPIPAAPRMAASPRRKPRLESSFSVMVSR